MSSIYFANRIFRVCFFGWCLNDPAAEASSCLVVVVQALWRWPPPSGCILESSKKLSRPHTTIVAFTHSLQSIGTCPRPHTLSYRQGHRHQHWTVKYQEPYTLDPWARDRGSTPGSPALCEDQRIKWNPDASHPGNASRTEHGGTALDSGAADELSMSPAALPWY